MSLSYFFYGVTSTFLVVLRSVETVNVSVAIYGVSFAVNVFFNYVFIFGKFGAPRMGVAGAAVGTVLARVAEFVMIIAYMLVWEKKIRFRLHMLLWPSGGLARDLVRYGLPVMLNELLWSVAISMHSVILGHMSSDIVAANSICNVMFQMATSIILGCPMPRPFWWACWWARGIIRTPGPVSTSSSRSTPSSAWCARRCCWR